MTLKERAAAIIDCLSGSCDCEAHGQDDEAQVEKHLREIYEDAAKIADEDIEWAGNNHCSCGERIRARAL